MAKKDNKEKKKGGGCAGAVGIIVVAIILVVVLLVSFVFSIFNKITSTITNMILRILEALLEFLAHPIKWVINTTFNVVNYISSKFNGEFNPEGLEATQPNQLITIEEKDFQNLKTELENSGINKETLGLDDIMLKKMLLAYNSGKYSHNADIIIQLTEEEVDNWKKDNTLSDPYEVKQGKDIDQITMNIVEHALDIFKEIFNSETNPNAALQNNYYLCTKGVLKFVYIDEEEEEDKKEKEMVYYNAEVMQKLYEEFEKNRYGAIDGYAESIWKYLSTCCYTDGDKGMKIYGHETVIEELVEWTFEDNDPDANSFKEIAAMILEAGDSILENVAINKQLIDKKYLKYSSLGGLLDTAYKTYEMQDIDIYSLVSEYSTPVELLVDLLDISSSKEFVNAFIDKVTNQTEIKLKSYKVRQLKSEEKTEETKEKTSVKSEAIVNAEVTEYSLDNDLNWYKGNNGVKTNVSLKEKKVLGVNTLIINVKLTDIPDTVDSVKVKVKFAASDDAYYYTLPNEIGSGIINIFSDALDTSYEFEVKSWFTERYKWRTNDALIKQYTTKLTTETKIDMAVETAKTWYGNFIFDNAIQTNSTYETIDSNGQRVNTSQGAPIMITKTKATEVYTRGSLKTYTQDGITVSRDDLDAVAIFADKSLSNFAFQELGSRIEKWYAQLDGDDVSFWLLPGGHLTHEIYTQLNSNKGYQLSNINELLNIRLTYAMDNGPADGWVKSHYKPVSMQLQALEYKEGYLYETYNQDVQTMASRTEENPGFFLSLLKNSTGTYNKDEAYNPRGKEIEYETIYGKKLNVGERLSKTGGDEWLFDLLSSSPNTQGLENAMRYILYKYSGSDYGITEWSFEIFDTKNMVTINSETE